MDNNHRGSAAYSIFLSIGQRHTVGLYSWTVSKGRDRDFHSLNLYIRPEPIHFDVQAEEQRHLRRQGRESALLGPTLHTAELL